MGESTTGQYLFDKAAMERELKEFHHGFKGILSEVSHMRLIKGSMDIIYRHTMGFNVPGKTAGERTCIDGCFAPK